MKKNDFVLVILILVIAFASLFVILFNRTPGALVHVSVGGREMGVYSLNEDAEYVLNGGTNILVIENGFAYMKSADCPDGTCVKTGRISYTGQRIVCLPNKVLVEIRGFGEEILGG